MASIRITYFAGLLPELDKRLLPANNAQVAHNCLLLDGVLRPYPKWRKVQDNPDIVNSAQSSLWYNESADAITFSPLVDCVGLFGAPFANNTFVGGGHVYFLPVPMGVQYINNPSIGALNAEVLGTGLTGSVSYTRSYDSIKPVNRIYAVSRVRKTENRAEEGPLILLGNQSATDILYEGDLVSISLNNSTLDDNLTHVRIYRTVTGLDTGQAITNDLDTNWHLVGEIPISVVTGGEVYVDGDSATVLPFDMYYANTFHGLRLRTEFFGLTETGWFIAGSSDGTLAVSERYLYHAWPTDNYAKLPQIVDMAIFDDNVFVGTNSRPYIVAISTGDKATQVAAKPYGESVPCLPGTMAVSASGVMYASKSGIVSLSREGMRMLTRDLLNGNDNLYHRKTKVQASDPSPGVPGDITTTVADVRIDQTVFGHYWRGQYIGFVPNPVYANLPVELRPAAMAYVLHTGSDAVDDTKFQRLVTIDGPTFVTPTYAVNGRQGIYVMARTYVGGAIGMAPAAFSLPIPGSGADQEYATAEKMQYRWKSKRFIMPGRTTFGAIKVVKDHGCLTIKIYMQGCCIYDGVVQGCSPFRLPAQFAGIDWEIELIGEAAVYEVHMASTMQELTREQNG